MASQRLFRVVIPVPDGEAGAAFYAALLDDPGERVADIRHYFDCGGVILAVVDVERDRQAHDGEPFRPNPELIYLAVPDLEALLARAQDLKGAEITESIQTHPWGERSFYLRDPWGNPLCFVDERTAFTGGRFVP